MNTTERPTHKTLDRAVRGSASLEFEKNNWGIDHGWMWGVWFDGSILVSATTRKQINVYVARKAVFAIETLARKVAS